MSDVIEDYITATPAKRYMKPITPTAAPVVDRIDNLTKAVLQLVEGYKKQQQIVDRLVTTMEGLLATNKSMADSLTTLTEYVLPSKAPGMSARYTGGVIYTTSAVPTITDPKDLEW